MESCIKPTVLQHFAGGDITAILKGRKGARIREAARAWYSAVLHRAADRTKDATERKFVDECQQDFNEQEHVAVLTAKQLSWLTRISNRKEEA